MSRLRDNPWVLPASLVVALLLGLLPLPALLQPLRPYWLALVLAYWVIEAPERVGLGIAFASGVVADLLYGGVLGEQALRLVRVETRRFEFSVASAKRKPMQAIRTHARENVDRVREVIAWPVAASRSWRSGFLAGIFDAEGSYSDGILRISNTDAGIIGWIEESLRIFGFRFVIEHIHRDVTKPIDVVRLLGGLRESLRFFHSFDPAISRISLLQAYPDCYSPALAAANAADIAVHRIMRSINTKTQPD